MSTEEKKEEKGKVLRRVVAARLVVFAVVVTWVLGWLAFGLSLIPGLYPTIWEGDLTSAHPMEVAMFVWFILTFVIVGVWVAVKGYKFVGRWERE
jgi:hypothetical protein